MGIQIFLKKLISQDTTSSTSDINIADFLSILPFPFLLYEEDGRIVQMNDSMKKICKKKNTRGFISLIDKVKYTNETVDLGTLFRAVVENRSSNKIRGAKIGDRLYEFFLFPVHNGGNTKTIGALIVNDITYFDEVDKMKTEFVALASHQLRTPLSAIRWNIEILNESNLDQKQREYTDDVYQSTTRMIKLVNDILSVSRFETDLMELHWQDIDLAAHLKGIIKDLQPFSHAKNCSLTLKFNRRKKYEIRADTELLDIALRSVIDNAIRYADHEKDSTVVVTLEKNDASCVIKVEDNGVGIPLELQNRIFEKFFRSPDAILISSDGSGISLYKSQMIIERLKGKIWFESSYKKGSSFFLSFPV